MKKNIVSFFEIALLFLVVFTGCKNPVDVDVKTADSTEEVDSTIPFVPDLIWYSIPVDKATNGKVTASTKEVLFGVYPQSKAEGITIDIRTAESKQSSKEIDNMGRDIYYYKNGENWYSNPATITSCKNEWYKVEPIEWQVLKVENGKALLVSKNALEADAYLAYEDSCAWKKQNDVFHTANNYKYSMIRAYLLGTDRYKNDSTGNSATYDYKFRNNGFIQKAFTESAREYLLENQITIFNDTEIDIEDYERTINVTDKIFLLSKEEVESYIPNAEDRIRKVTDYAYRRNDISSTSGIMEIGSNKEAKWYLRTPDVFLGRVIYVKHDGSFDESNVDKSFYGLVPAIEISVR